MSTEQATEKSFKLSEKQREYHKVHKREERERTRIANLVNFRCAVCGAQAIVKVLRTQQELCLRDFVAYAKNNQGKA